MTKPKMMSQADKADAYNTLRARANELGYPTIGEALETVKRKDG